MVRITFVLELYYYYCVYIIILLLYLLLHGYCTVITHDSITQTSESSFLSLQSKYDNCHLKLDHKNYEFNAKLG